MTLCMWLHVSATWACLASVEPPPTPCGTSSATAASYRCVDWSRRVALVPPGTPPVWLWRRSETGGSTRELSMENCMKHVVSPRSSPTACPTALAVGSTEFIWFYGLCSSLAALWTATQYCSTASKRLRLQSSSWDPLKNTKKNTKSPCFGGDCYGWPMGRPWALYLLSSLEGQAALRKQYNKATMALSDPPNINVC